MDSYSIPADFIITAGLVIANDADYKRSHMLVHQCRRLASPCFVATHHDATHFPNIHLKVCSSTHYSLTNGMMQLF